MLLTTPEKTSREADAFFTRKSQLHHVPASHSIKRENTGPKYPLVLPCVSHSKFNVKNEFSFNKETSKQSSEVAFSQVAGRS